MGMASSKVRCIDTRTHEHPFSLRNDKIEKTILCKICDCSITAGPYYVCDICKYYIHESCYALPHQIDHSFHPSHALTLYWRDEYWCGSCHKHFSYRALSYRCDEDDFDIDIECALMPPMTCEGQTHIQHFSHQHPMPLLELGVRDEIQCFACQSTSSGAFYGCTKCKYFLHKSCAELPTNYGFRHPVHSDHGLYQLCVQHEPFCCSSCNKKTKCTFVFKCTSCDFMMCVKCYNKKYPTIKHKYHEHLLCLTEYYKYLDRCNAYDGYCQSSVVSEELDATKYHVFGCKDCSFIVHLLCGPLPRIIKHESHLHSLSLAPSIIEDTSGEYYCDYCETERDPRVRFYRCEECKYTAHVRCVILEVLNVLNGDLKDVELKVVREDLWENEIGKEEALTMLDMINAFPSWMIQWIGKYYKWESTKNLDMGRQKDSHFKVEDEIPTKLRRQIAEKKAQLEICEKFGTSSKSRFLEEGLNKASEWKWKRTHEGLF